MYLHLTWSRFLPIFCAVVLLCVPGAAYAKVYISEVAWAGSDDNANAEWIELYNDGVAQSLTGWQLAAQDGQPVVALTGTIGSNSYALLERTTDDTLPGVAAFVVYTGALGNAGEVIELRNAAGTLEDTVNGSEAWQIGGDNETKDTLQRKGEPATGAWTTAPATPGRGGAVASVIHHDDDEQQTTSGGIAMLTGTKHVEETVVRLEPSLTLDPGENRTVSVGVPIDFDVRSFKESGKEVVVEDVVWNFGDGAIQKGRSVSHAYVYVGTYVVTVEGRRTGFLREVRDTARFEVTVVEPSFAIVHADEKYIEVENTSEYELDVSGYSLGVGSKSFLIPEGTIILPQTTIRFPKQVTKLVVHEGHTTGIFYPDQRLAQSYRVPTVNTAPVASVAYTPQAVPSPVAAVSSESFSSESSSAPVPLSVGPTEQGTTLPEYAAVAQAYGEVSAYTQEHDVNLAWWLLGLLAAILTALATVLLIRKEQAEIIAGYEIEE